MASSLRTKLQKCGIKFLWLVVMIKFHCHSCNTKIGVQEEYVGRCIRCPRCGSTIKIQTSESASSSPQKTKARKACEHTQYSVFICKEEPPSEQQDILQETAAAPLFSNAHHEHVAVLQVSPRFIIWGALLALLGCSLLIYFLTC